MECLNGIVSAQLPSRYQAKPADITDDEFRVLKLMEVTRQEYVEGRRWCSEPSVADPV